jgi:hypothetical protein
MCIPPIVARQRISKHIPATMNTRNNRRIIGRVVFYTVRVVSKESLWTCLCIPLSLLGNGSTNIFPRQRRIVGGVVLYAMQVISKESRRLVLTSTSCSFRVIGVSSRIHCFSGRPCHVVDSYEISVPCDVTSSQRFNTYGLIIYKSLQTCKLI